MRPAAARRPSATPRPGQEALARLCLPPSQGPAGQPAHAPGDRLAMVAWWPNQGQGDLALIDCARGLDAQAESWRLQGHCDSACNKEVMSALPKLPPPITGRQRRQDPTSGAASLWQPASLSDSTTPAWTIPPCPQFLARAAARTTSGLP